MYLSHKAILDDVKTFKLQETTFAIYRQHGAKFGIRVKE